MNVTLLKHSCCCFLLQESFVSRCSFWDQGLDNDYGGWSEEGCQLIRETQDQVMCECDHLTNFAILTDTTIEAEASIQYYTIAGVAIAFICVLIVLVAAVVTR